MTVLSAAERARLHWESVLDRLELDVDRTEALLEGHHAVAVEPWEPPTPEWPMPADLAARAQAVHARQQDVTRRLVASLHDVRQQQAFTAKVDRAAGPAPSVARFVDVSA